MRKDHRPYFLKQAYLKLQKFYANRVLGSQFELLGKGHSFIKPWYVEVFGCPIQIGDFVTVIAAPDKRVRFSIWSNKTNITGIKIGNHCLISPGVRISAATEIIIGDNCMFASGAYITDSNWHGIYDRSYPIGKTEPVRLEENVWIGDSAIVGKGVTIGKNSIIGAGSVVIKNIPQDTIAAGNPAKVIKELDPDRQIITRSNLYLNPQKLSEDFKKLDRLNLKENTFFHWMRTLFFPKIGD